MLLSTSSSHNQAKGSHLKKLVSLHNHSLQRYTSSSKLNSISSSSFHRIVGESGKGSPEESKRLNDESSRVLVQRLSEERSKKDRERRRTKRLSRLEGVEDGSPPTRNLVKNSSPLSASALLGQTGPVKSDQRGDDERRSDDSPFLSVNQDELSDPDQSPPGKSTNYSSKAPPSPYASRRPTSPDRTKLGRSFRRPRPSLFEGSSRRGSVTSSAAQSLSNPRHGDDSHRRDSVPASSSSGGISGQNALMEGKVEQWETGPEAVTSESVTRLISELSFGTPTEDDSDLAMYNVFRAQGLYSDSGEGDDNSHCASTTGDTSRYASAVPSRAVSRRVSDTSEFTVGGTSTPGGQSTHRRKKRLSQRRISDVSVMSHWQSAKRKFRAMKAINNTEGENVSGSAASTARTRRRTRMSDASGRVDPNAVIAQEYGISGINFQQFEKLMDIGDQALMEDEEAENETLTDSSTESYVTDTTGTELVTETTSTSVSESESEESEAPEFTPEELAEIRILHEKTLKIALKELRMKHMWKRARSLLDPKERKKTRWWRELYFFKGPKELTFRVEKKPKKRDTEEDEWEDMLRRKRRRGLSIVEDVKSPAGDYTIQDIRKALEVFYADRKPAFEELREYYSDPHRPDHVLSDENLMSLETLRFAPAVVSICKKIYNLLDTDSGGRVWEKTYIDLYKKLYCVLLPKYKPKDAEVLARSEWVQDCEGKPFLDYDKFMLTTYQLAATWTDVVDEGKIINFLKLVYDVITAKTTDGDTRMLSIRELMKKQGVLSHLSTKKVDQIRRDSVLLEQLESSSSEEETQQLPKPKKTPTKKPKKKKRRKVKEKKVLGKFVEEKLDPMFFLKFSKKRKDVVRASLHMGGGAFQLLDDEAAVHSYGGAPKNAMYARHRHRHRHHQIGFASSDDGHSSGEIGEAGHGGDRRPRKKRLQDILAESFDYYVANRANEESDASCPSPTVMSLQKKYRRPLDPGEMVISDESVSLPKLSIQAEDMPAITGDGGTSPRTANGLIQYSRVNLIGVTDAEDSTETEGYVSAGSRRVRVHRRVRRGSYPDALSPCTPKVKDSVSIARTQMSSGALPMTPEAGAPPPCDATPIPFLSLEDGHAVPFGANPTAAAETSMPPVAHPSPTGKIRVQVKVNPEVNQENEPPVDVEAGSQRDEPPSPAEPTPIPEAASPCKSLPGDAVADGYGLPRRPKSANRVANALPYEDYISWARSVCGAQMLQEPQKRDSSSGVSSKSKHLLRKQLKAMNFSLSSEDKPFSTGGIIGSPNKEEGCRVEGEVSKQGESAQRKTATEGENGNDKDEKDDSLHSNSDAGEVSDGKNSCKTSPRVPDDLGKLSKNAGNHRQRRRASVTTSNVAPIWRLDGDDDDDDGSGDCGAEDGRHDGGGHGSNSCGSDIASDNGDNGDACPSSDARDCRAMSSWSNKVHSLPTSARSTTSPRVSPGRRASVPCFTLDSGRQFHFNVKVSMSFGDSLKDISEASLETAKHWLRSPALVEGSSALPVRPNTAKGVRQKTSFQSSSRQIHDMHHMSPIPPPVMTASPRQTCSDSRGSEPQGASGSKEGAISSSGSPFLSGAVVREQSLVFDGAPAEADGCSADSNVGIATVDRNIDSASAVGHDSSNVAIGAGDVNGISSDRESRGGAGEVSGIESRHSHDGDTGERGNADVCKQVPSIDGLGEETRANLTDGNTEAGSVNHVGRGEAASPTQPVPDARESLLEIASRPGSACSRGGTLRSPILSSRPISAPPEEIKVKTLSRQILKCGKCKLQPLTPDPKRPGWGDQFTNTWSWPGTGHSKPVVKGLTGERWQPAAPEELLGEVGVFKITPSALPPTRPRSAMGVVDNRLRRSLARQPRSAVVVPHPAVRIRYRRGNRKASLTGWSQTDD